MFENKLTTQGIHYSRYIASWYKSGGNSTHEFKQWLKNLGLNETEIEDITEMINCGKLELESLAKRWIYTHSQ